jgi:hypothetical protein
MPNYIRNPIRRGFGQISFRSNRGRNLNVLFLNDLTMPAKRLPPMARGFVLLICAGHSEGSEKKGKK